MTEKLTDYKNLRNLFVRFFIPSSLVVFRNNLLAFFSKRQITAVFGLFIIVGISPFFSPQLTSFLDLGIIDSIQRVLSYFRAPGTDIVIVAIDEKSIRELGKPWPWSRKIFADLLQKIGNCRPHSIICDILFQHPGKREEDDQILAETIKNLGNVGLINLVEKVETPRGLKISTFASTEKLRENAQFEGFVWAWIDGDGLIRSFVTREEKTGMKSVAVEAATRFKKTLELPPADSDMIGRCLLAMTDPKSGKVISAGDILSNQFSTRDLQDRIVLIGVTTQEQRDFHQTPWGTIPGIQFLGLSIDSLLQGRTFKRIVHSNWLILLSFLGILGGGYCFLHNEPKVGKPLFLYLPGSCAALFSGGLFFHFFIPLGPFVFGWGWTTIIMWSAFNLFEAMDTQKIRREAEVVGNLQKNFFPEEKWVSPLGYECFGVCFPFEKAAGDYYDYFECGDDTFFFLLGDVSGHGYGAGLVTSLVKALITELHFEGIHDLDKVTDTLNDNLLASLNKAKMMTGVFGRLFLKENRIQLKFAGHPPILILKPDGSTEHHGRPNFPLGAVRKKFPTTLLELPINPGEMVVLYSDGIIESPNWDDEQYTMDRWLEYLRTTGPFDSIETFMERALVDMSIHIDGRPYTDDVSMLVLRRKPE